MAVAECLLLSFLLVGDAWPHDPEQRLAALRAAAAAAPGDPVPCRALAVALGETGAVGEAREAFRGLLARWPADVAARLAAAAFELGVGQPAVALSHLRAAAAVGADGAVLQTLRGRAHRDLGQPAAAAVAFAKAWAAARPTPELVLDLAAARLADPSPGGGAEAALAALERGLTELGPVVALVDAAIELDRRAGRLDAAVARLAALRARCARPGPWQSRLAALREAGARAELGASVPDRFPARAGVVGRDRGSLPPPSLPNVLVPAGATWRYHDGAVDLGAAWLQPGYPDTSWPTAPAQFGFGDGDESTSVAAGPVGLRTPTYYFRHHFQLDDAAVPDLARLRLLADDGAVVWLNGIEIARHNIANGPVPFAYYASWSVGGAQENDWRTFAVPLGAFVPGDNVLAVEVHQSDPNGTDLSFDLGLEYGAAPATVLRGPYLQNGTPTSAVLRWRTDQPTASCVWLGTQIGNLALVHAAQPLVRDHSVPLAGLQPDTTYYYAVGDATGPLAGPGAEFRLRTLPPIGVVQPLRVWVLGDAGFATFPQKVVRELYLAHAASRPADAVLFLGDNAYYSGTDAEYQNGLFDIYGPELRSTFAWSTLGNHDAASAASATQRGPYFEAFDLPTAGEAGGLPSGTEAYYAFDRGHVHFVCLDSMDSDRTATGAMASWLRADLAATAARWVVVFFHHPAYSAGSHDSDLPTDSGGRMTDMRQVVLPILEAAGVDLVLGGHSHSYERSALLDGHYGVRSTLQPAMVLDRGDGDEAGDGSYGKPSVGRAAHEGAVYVVAGSAGAIGGGRLDHPVMVRSLNRFGSLLLDFDGDRLDAAFVGIAGVEDRFTIQKGERRTLQRVETGVSVGGGGRQEFRLAAGSVHAGRLYLLAGAFGTSPGITVGGVAVPLNADPWLQLSLAFAGSSLYPGSFGQLDGSGAATAALVLPPLVDPSLVGSRLYHAFLVVDGTAVVHVSNPVRTALRP